MSVLIKGMRMPENCLECEWHEYYSGDYDWCHACRKTGTMPIENAETQRADDCPLVELPEKHGRLIDADEINFSMTNSTDQDIAEEAINETPTVIEAEGE